MEKQLWRLTISAPHEAMDRLRALLANEAPSGWREEAGETGEDFFEIYSEDKTWLEKLAKASQSVGEAVSVRIDDVENKDWRLAWREYFTPVEAGERFVVLPPWLAHLEHSKRQEIVIDPKNAFGTGHHVSTVLCLEALGELLDQNRFGKRDWFLDLGCGTGILGIAAAKAGLSGTGLDVDPAAIANSRENRELNEVPNLELLLGSLEKVKGEKYELVMANILAQPLIDMAPALTACLSKKGCLILGGILNSQADAVADAYKACGLGEPKRLSKDEWVALMWE